MGMQTTFIMVKPDGVQRGLVGNIIQRFETKGLRLVGLRQRWLLLRLVVGARPRPLCRQSVMIGAAEAFLRRSAGAAAPRP